MSLQDFLITLTAGFAIVMSVGIPLNVLLFWFVNQERKK